MSLINQQAMLSLKDDQLFNQFMATKESVDEKVVPDPEPVFPASNVVSPMVQSHMSLGGVSKASALSQKTDHTAHTAHTAHTVHTTQTQQSHITSLSKKVGSMSVLDEGFSVLRRPSTHNSNKSSIKMGSASVCERLDEGPATSSMAMASLEGLDVYCQQCFTPISTQDALYGKHRGHLFAPLDEAFKMSANEARSHLAQLEQHCNSMRAFQTELKSLNDKVVTVSEVWSEQVRSNVALLHKALDQKQAAMLKTIQEEKETKQSALDNQAKEISDKVEKFEELIAVAMTMLESSTSVQYLRKHKFLCEQIEAAATPDDQLAAAIKAEMPFRMDITEPLEQISALNLTAEMDSDPGRHTHSAPASTHSEETDSSSTPPAGTVNSVKPHDGYVSNLDRSGAFYHLGTAAAGYDEFVNPLSTGMVTVSASEWGYADHLDKICWQENSSSVFTSGKPESWICFTLNNGYALRPSRYRIQHAGDCKSHVPRSWVLEASATGDVWDVLSIHNNDTSLASEEGSHASWAIASESIKNPYAMFRITITGPNSSQGYHIMLGSVEFWGVLTKN